jgi:hypothetical protein
MVNGAPMENADRTKLNQGLADPLGSSEDTAMLSLPADRWASASTRDASSPPVLSARVGLTPRVPAAVGSL